MINFPKPPPLPSRKRDAPQDASAKKRAWKYLGPEELLGLKNLYFAARVIVEGAYAGGHKSPYKGSAAEFVDYREYYPGDEIRSIDWKAYARTDRYFVKLFEKETDMTAHLLVDRSASMGYGGKDYKHVFPTQEMSKLDYAAYLAAALAYLLVKQGDRVGLTLFDKKITGHVPAGSSFTHLNALLSLLERQRAGRTTSISKTLRDAYALFKRRGMLIVISDFLDDPLEIFRALDMYRHRNFEIILFHILHRYEAKLPPLANVNFVDAETGEFLTTTPSDIAAQYESELQSFMDTLSSYAQARNIDYNCVNTQTPHSDVLQRYLLRRGGVQ